MTQPPDMPASEGPHAVPGTGASGQFPDRYQLADTDNARLFDELIVASEFTGTSPAASPTVIFTGGQAGSGKSHAKTLLAQRFSAEGYVDIGTDSLRVYHPRWLDLLDEDPATATLLTQLDAQAWVARSVSYAAHRGFNVIMDSTLSRVGEVADFLQTFHVHGYRTEVAFVATPVAVSWLGNLARYQGQVEAKGRGRISLREPYERGAAQIVDAVTRLEGLPTIDQISAYRRGGELIYRNVRGPEGTWAQLPGIASVIEHERARRWTPGETDEFLKLLTSLIHRMGPQHRPDLAYAIELAANRAATTKHQHELRSLHSQLTAGSGHAADRPPGPGAVDRPTVTPGQRAANVFQVPPPESGIRRPTGRASGPDASTDPPRRGPGTPRPDTGRSHNR